MTLAPGFKLIQSQYYRILFTLNCVEKAENKEKKLPGLAN